MKYFYTNKNLIDVIRFYDSKTFIECGIDDKSLIQITVNGVVNSFMIVLDENAFKSNCDVSLGQYISKEDMDLKINELQIERDKFEKEYEKTLPEYRISELEKTVKVLKQENADLNYALIEGGLI